ncbi:MULTISPECIES: hypothetical protein, partial [unclassified Methylobacterium]|uniref:hypothetical protein n=1 Tax=unclassified Methylobacterium TaxID=2615210 RepID=UPI00226A365E
RAGCRLSTKRRRWCGLKVFPADLSLEMQAPADIEAGSLLRPRDASAQWRSSEAANLPAR